MLRMSSQKVAIVTGSNKGIGFAIVELLCKQLGSGWDVFVTSRDEGRGAEAVKELNAKGVNPKYHQLDIDDKGSIEKLANFLKSTYGGVDILVNNAGVGFPGNSPVPFAEQAKVTIGTNFFSTLNVCNSLFPLLRPHARVVHIASTVSDMTLNKCSPELQKKLTGNLGVDELKNLMTEFIDTAQKGSVKDLGWLESAYGASKVGVRLLTYAQAKAMESDPREDVVINCCCPGYVITDMTSQSGKKTIYEGADTPVYLATLEPNVSKDFVGKHFYEREVISWRVGNEISL